MKIDPLPALAVFLEHALPTKETGVGSEEAMTSLVAAGRLGRTCRTLRAATKDHTEYVRVYRALNDAARTADLAGIEKAIAEGAHPDGFRATMSRLDKTHPVWLREGAFTPLHLVFGGNALNETIAASVAVASYALVRAGANVNAAVPGAGRTPLMEACRRGFFTSVPGLLLSHGVDVNRTDCSGSTALLDAVTLLSHEAYVGLPFVKTIKALVRAGADPNARRGDTVLCKTVMALMNADTEHADVVYDILRVLLEAGAVINPGRGSMWG